MEGRLHEKRQVLKLAQNERAELELLVSRGNVPGWMIRRAQCLLACDGCEGGLGCTDAQAGVAYGCSSRSVETWRLAAIREGSRKLCIASLTRSLNA